MALYTGAMGIFDTNQSDTYRIEGGAGRDLLIWAVLFDFWMYVLSGAGAALTIIGLLSSASISTATAAVNVVPIVGQIVGTVLTGLGVTTSTSILLVGIALSFVAAMVGVALSMVLNGLFRQQGVNVFARSIAWRIVTVIVTKIIPGFGMLPLFTIFTALSINHARNEDRTRTENEANIFTERSV